MKPLGGYWLVHNKYRFLLAVMEELAGNAHIAFEGDFSGLEIMKAAGIPEEKTPLLGDEQVRQSWIPWSCPWNRRRQRAYLDFLGELDFKGERHSGGLSMFKLKRAVASNSPHTIISTLVSTSAPPFRGNCLEPDITRHINSH